MAIVTHRLCRAGAAVENPAHSPSLQSLEKIALSNPVSKQLGSLVSLRSISCISRPTAFAATPCLPSGATTFEPCVIASPVFAPAAIQPQPPSAAAPAIPSDAGQRARVRASLPAAHKICSTALRSLAVSSAHRGRAKARAEIWRPSFGPVTHAIAKA